MAVQPPRAFSGARPRERGAQGCSRLAEPRSGGKRARKPGPLAGKRGAPRRRQPRDRPRCVRCAALRPRKGVAKAPPPLCSPWEEPGGGHDTQPCPRGRFPPAAPLPQILGGGARAHLPRAVPSSSPSRSCRAIQTRPGPRPQQEPSPAAPPPPHGSRSSRQRGSVALTLPLLQCGGGKEDPAPALCRAHPAGTRREGAPGALSREALRPAGTAGSPPWRVHARAPGNGVRVEPRARLASPGAPALSFWTRGGARARAPPPLALLQAEAPSKPSRSVAPSELRGPPAYLRLGCPALRAGPCTDDAPPLA